MLRMCKRKLLKHPLPLIATLAVYLSVTAKQSNHAITLIIYKSYLFGCFPFKAIVVRPTVLQNKTSIVTLPLKISISLMWIKKVQRNTEINAFGLGIFRINKSCNQKALCATVNRDKEAKADIECRLYYVFNVCLHFSLCCSVSGCCLFGVTIHSQKSVSYEF